MRRAVLGLAAVATAIAALVLPQHQGGRTPAEWLDDLCPAAQIEAVAQVTDLESTAARNAAPQESLKGT